MQQAERILFLLIGLGFVMDAFQLPFAGMVYSAGLALLALFYLGLSAVLLPRPGRSDQVLPLSIMAGMALCAAVLAFLFKVQRWPGVVYLLGAALVLCSVTVAAALVLRRNRPALGAYFKAVLLRATTGLGIALFLLVQGFLH